MVGLNIRVHSGMRVRFRYRNWRGTPHSYEIVVESIEFAPHGADDSGIPVWQMHGYVLTRDDDPRPEMGENRRRSFILHHIEELTA